MFRYVVHIGAPHRSPSILFSRLFWFFGYFCLEPTLLEHREPNGPGVLVPRMALIVWLLCERALLLKAGTFHRHTSHSRALGWPGWSCPLQDSESPSLLASSLSLFCSSDSLLVSLESTSFVIRTRIFVSVCCWGAWSMTPKQQRIPRNLPSKIDVEVGSHGNSPSSKCTRTKSRIHHGCNGTSVKESGYNRERKMFSEGLKTEPLERNYLSTSPCNLLMKGPLGPYSVNSNNIHVPGFIIFIA